MFKYPYDITYTTMAPKTKIEPTWFGGKFAPAPRLPNPNNPEHYVASLVIQYIEGYIYRTYGLYRANDTYIETLYNKAKELELNDDSDNDPNDLPQLKYLMKACQHLGYVCNGIGSKAGGSALDLEIGYVKNTANDLKYFIRQYGQLILETKITSSTYNQYNFLIDSIGNDLEYDEYSKGFIMYGYDSQYIYIQNSLGPFVGKLGFHAMPWSIVPDLVLRGVCWQLKNPS